MSTPMGQLLISCLILIYPGHVCKVNGSPVSILEEVILDYAALGNEPRATPRDEVTEDEKIQLCANHLREMIMYMCRHNTLAEQRYYSPDAQIEPPSYRNIAEHHRGRHEHIYQPTVIVESSDGLENQIIIRRSRRQVVQECCDKPCFKKDLVKYCDTRSLPTSATSTQPKTGPASHNRIRRSRNGKLTNWQSDLNPEVEKENEVQNADSSTTAKPRPCRCRNKRRRKANGKPALLPTGYLPYQMLFVPYGNNIPPVGPANNAAMDVSERTAGAFLHLNLNDEPKNFIPSGNWNWGRSLVLPTPKNQRQTFQNPLSQQRGLGSMNSDERDMEFQTNELGTNSYYHTHQHRQSLPPPPRSSMSIITDAPDSPEDPISFSSGTNDNVYF